jgi:hypothetical protein
VTTMTEADPAIVEAYREQAEIYGAAMIVLLEAGRHQAATLLAVQTVRSAALTLLAACVDMKAVDEDPISLLWNMLPAVREIPALQQGANILALHDDLTLYAYEVDIEEARDAVTDAAAFSTWALGLETSASIRLVR